MSSCRISLDFHQRWEKRQIRQIYLCYFFQLVLFFGICTSCAISTSGASSITDASSTTGASRIGKCHNLRCFVANLTILSQMGKCRNLRVFGANFLGPNLHLCYSTRFFHLCPFSHFFTSNGHRKQVFSFNAYRVQSESDLPRKNIAPRKLHGWDGR